MTRLSGMTAMITGAGGGIGRAVTHALADAGASVAINDIAETMLAELVDELAARGHNAMALEGDMTEAKQAREAIRRLVGQRGRLDILVNAAGICPTRPFEETTDQEWDRVFAVNVRATFLCCREAIPHMLERGEGRIVNIASNAGKTAEPFIVPYSASKFAVVGLTQGLALEYARRGIRVNCVCPAMCETAMMERLAVDYARLHGGDVDEWRRRFHDEVPVGRMARPGDVAHAVLFLADPASEFMTGQALNVSGGLEVH